MTQTLDYTPRVKPTPPPARFKSAYQVQREKDAISLAKIEEEYRQERERVIRRKARATRKHLKRARQQEFNRFLEEGVLSARDTLVCPSRKIAYQDEDAALKARQKWYDLELHTFSGEGSYVYHCSCGHWHMSKQDRES